MSIVILYLAAALLGWFKLTVAQLREGLSAEVGRGTSRSGRRGDARCGGEDGGRR